MFVEGISKIVPMIDNIKGNYELSQVARLYFSVMWFMSPFLIWILYREDKLLNINRDKLKESEVMKEAIVFFFILCVYVFFAYFIGPDPLDDTSKYSIILRDRFGMAMYGCIVYPLGVVLVVNLIIIFFKFE